MKSFQVLIQPAEGTPLSSEKDLSSGEGNHLNHMPILSDLY